MKILVPIKRTPHRDVKMRIASDGQSLATSDIKFEINPFDEIAVEEAIRMKEAGKAQHVDVVTVGPAESHEQMLAALAMGADRAIRVDAPQGLDALQIARCLAAVIRREQPDLVLMGKLATDEENWQVGPMLAQFLGWPQASFASKIELIHENRTALVTCEVDAGLEKVEVDLPAVITTDLRLNEPRYSSLPAIMKAKRKPIDVINLADMGDLGTRRSETTRFAPLPAKPKGVQVDSVDQLVGMLSDRNLI